MAGSMTLPKREHDGVVEYWAEKSYGYTKSVIAGTVQLCTFKDEGTTPGTLGFSVIAYDDQSSLDRTFSATPYSTASPGLERYVETCKGSPLPPFHSNWGGFNLMLTAVYAPASPGPFHARSTRPLVNWQAVETGVLRRTITRTVTGYLNTPIAERSTYTRRLVP